MMSWPLRPSSSKPNKYEISKEDIKLIFKIICREVKVKMNLQGLYDYF